MTKKVIHISFNGPFKLLCHFNSGEKRVLDLEKTLDKSQKYSSKIFEDDTFYQAEVGPMGQIYWENIAEIRTLNGKIELCEYDISPEFAYENSQPS